jgi:hypothetical protein
MTENGVVKCLDCDGKMFKPTTNRKLGGFMTHLRSKTHMSNVIRQQEKLGSSECYFPNIPTTIPAMDFNIPHPPLMVFANQRPEPAQDLVSMFTAIGNSLQNDASRKDIRVSFVESRVREMEKINKEQQRRIDTSLAARERQKAEELELVAETLASFEEKQKKFAREAGDHARSAAEKSKEQLLGIEARMNASRDASKGQLEHMSTLLVRSDQRNINKIEEITKRIDKSLLRFEERQAQLSIDIRDLQDVNRGQNVIIHELDSQLAEKTKDLKKIAETQSDKVYTLKSRVDESTEQIAAFRKIGTVQTDKTRYLESQLKENIRELNGLMELVEAQDESIHDLESQCQLLRDARQQHEQEIAGHMAANFQQTAKQIEELKEQTAEQLKNIMEQHAAIFEKRSAELSAVFERSITEHLAIIHQQSAWIQKLEKETSSKFLSMESFKKKQEDYREGLEGVISGIMEDAVQMREFVQEIVSSVATQPPPSSTKTQASV